MKKVIINNTNINHYDSKMTKARAIVTDESNNIYVINMNDSYILPGGTVENNETPYQTLIRELKEELGLDNIEPTELIEIDYYHKNFPKYKKEGTETRLNKVYYYNLTIHSSNIKESTFTEYEKTQHSKIEKYPIAKLIKLLQKNNDNKYKIFTDKELEIILNYYLNK